jgi:hypothetical protein
MSLHPSRCERNMCGLKDSGQSYGINPVIGPYGSTLNSPRIHGGMRLKYR